jgi:hypothetical protein
VARPAQLVFPVNAFQLPKIGRGQFHALPRAVAEVPHSNDDADAHDQGNSVEHHPQPTWPVLTVVLQLRFCCGVALMSRMRNIFSGIALFTDRRLQVFVHGDYAFVHASLQQRRVPSISVRARASLDGSSL